MTKSVRRLTKETQYRCINCNYQSDYANDIERHFTNNHGPLFVKVKIEDAE